MLYISTNDKNDVHTAYKALRNNYAPNGGSFVPFHLPQLSTEQIRGLKSKTFGDIIAEMLNMFFSTKLTGWDIDFALGRNVTKVKSLSGEIFVAELWHNAGGQFQHLVNELYAKVRADEQLVQPTQWFCIAVRISVLFAIYGTLIAEFEVSRNTSIDLSVTATDLTVPAAAFFARKMGLPVDSIICTCEENSGIWEFLYRGVRQSQCHMPDAFSSFVCSMLGVDALPECISMDTKQGSGTVSEELLSTIKENVFTAAVGQQRIDFVINSAYRTHQYIFHPAAAMAFGGLQDYRASRGEKKAALILEDVSPIKEQTRIASILNIKEKELTQRI